ncbi:MAG: LytTR family DNA-binding domain-containing protein [Cytophagales bacterium]
MRIAVIDDEKAVRETISAILLHYQSDIAIEEAHSVITGVELIRSFNPQLIFLDVEMGDGTGFDLLTRLETINCPVAFVTAHDHYAIKAFKFSAIDYILKPVDPKEIKLVLDKSISQRSGAQLQISSAADKSKQEFDKIVLADSASVHLVDISSIVLCKAVGNYTQFFFIDKKEMVISKTLKHYDSLLCHSDFLRIHQSYLINMQHLERYDKREGGEVIMKNGLTVPVSTRKREMLNEVLKTFKS